MLDICRLLMYNIYCNLKYGRLAQLVEPPLDVRAVEGSSPPASTKKISVVLRLRFLTYYLLAIHFSLKILTSIFK